jgi:hypothetical protein
MSAFGQLDRLSRVREDIGDDHYRDFEKLKQKRWVRNARDGRPVNLERLPVDEVFRRINAGEYLE